MFLQLVQDKSNTALRAKLRLVEAGEKVGGYELPLSRMATLVRTLYMYQLTQLRVTLQEKQVQQ